MTEGRDVNEIQEVFPYLIVEDAQKAIEFYKRVFGAAESLRLTEPNGRIGHAQLRFGAVVVMLAEEHPERGILSPLAFGGTGSMLHLHVLNVDELTRRAVNADAKVVAEPRDQFYGERSGKVLDPFGHMWMHGQHIEDVSTDEMQRRYTAALSKSE